MTISFGLESHIFGMKPELFWKIISNDVDGPNSDEEKRKCLRTFRIPDECIEKHSSDQYPRTVNIFAAFISSKWVFVLTDFVRLVRMHITSRDAIWTKEDFTVGSLVSVFFSESNLQYIFF